MKKISLLFTFIAIFAAASFAKTTTPQRTILQQRSAPVTETSCTVTTSWKSNGKIVKLTVTATCESCTQQAACNMAYAVLTIAIPG